MFTCSEGRDGHSDPKISSGCGKVHPATDYIKWTEN